MRRWRVRGAARGHATHVGPRAAWWLLRCALGREEEERPGRRLPVRAFLLFGFAELGEDAQVFQRGGVADALFAGGDVAQQAAHDLAAARLRQRVGEAD